MPPGGSDFLINIRTQFESAGLQQIVQQARQALTQLATVPPGQRVGAATDIRTSAETRISQLRQQALGGLEPGSKEFGAVSKQFESVRRSLTRAFTEMATGAADLGKLSPQLRRSIQSAIAQANQALNIPALRRATQAPGFTPAAAEGRDRALETRDRAVGNATYQETLAADRAYTDAQARITTAKAQQQAAIAQAIAADDSYATATAATAQARRLTGAHVQAATLGTDLTGIGREDVLGIEVANTLQERIQANLRAAAVARAEANRGTVAGQGLAESEAQLRSANRELAAIRQRESRAEVQAAIGRGEGTLFQRGQAVVQRPGGNQRLPSEFQTGPQFLASRAFTTAGFAIAGTALYGGVRVLGEMVREATELDRIMNQVNATLVSTGNAANGGLGQAKQGVLDIAASTGAQADVVAGVFQQFIGAFGDGAGGIDDVRVALDQTDKAMQVVAVTGLSLAEVLDSLTAVAKTFKTDIDSVSDSAIGLQERFGVMAKETITFVADLAPVAKDIGLSLQDLASLGAVAQQVSGKSGSALAENFNRVLPAIGDVSDAIIQFYNLPQLRGQRTQILGEFASGNTGAVFENLLRNYHLLTKAQQQQLITTLGSRRETATLVAVFENASKAVAEFDANAANVGRDNGKTQQYFQDLTSTVDLVKKRFSEIGKQIGVALFDSGLKDFFLDIVNLGGQAVSVLVALARVFAVFNDALGGLPVNLLLFMGLIRIMSPVIGLVTKAMAGKVAATEADAAVTATATRTNAGYNIVITEQAAVETADTAALVENNFAKTAGALTPGGIGRGLGGLAGRGATGLAGAARNVPGLLFGGGSVLGTSVGSATGFLGTMAAAAPVFLAFAAVSSFFNNSSKQAAQATADADRAYTAVQSALQGKGFGGESVEAAIARLRSESLAQATGGAGGLAAGNKYVTGQDLSHALLPGLGNVPGSGLAARGVNFVGGSASKVLSDLPGIGGLFGNQQSGNAALRAAGGQDQVMQKYEEGIAKALTEQYSEQFANLLKFRTEGFNNAIAGADETALASLNAVLDSGLKKTDAVKHVAATSGDKGKIEAGDLTPENIKILLDDGAKGGVMASKIIGLIFDFLGGVDGTLLTGANKEAATSAAGGVGAQSVQTLENAKKQFDAGAVGTGAYLAALQQARKDTQDQISARRSAGSVREEDVTALAQIDKQISEFLSNQYDARLKTMDTYASLVGDGPGGTDSGNDVKRALLDQRIQVLTTQVGDTKLTVEDRGKAMDDLIKALQDKFERDVDAIADPILREKTRKAGFVIPPAVRQLFATQQVAVDPATTAFITQMSEITGTGLQAYFNEIGQGVVDTAKSVKDIMLEIIDREIANLARFVSHQAYEPVDKELKAKIDALKGQRDAIAGATDIGTPTELGDRGYAGGGPSPGDTRRADAEAQAALARARANGDPVKVAQANLTAARSAAGEAKTAAEKTQARAQIIEAENALQDAQNDIVQARIDALSEQVKRDPVRQAQTQVQSAQHAVATAKGAAARIRANQQLADANKALDDAQFDITLARIEQTEALASAAGDTIGAAQAQVQTALAKLNEVLSDPGSGEAERIRAQNEVTAAAASARDADFEKQLNDIGFLQQMEWISTQQAIQMLTAMASYTAWTPQQYQQLLAKIKELTDAAKTDYQFNLPGNIDLPTLYETRRLNQTPGGSGYNDNRVVTINFTANNTADAEAIANTIVDGFSAPSRFGTASRRY